MQEPTHDVTPDGTYVFELQLEDGTRAVAVSYTHLTLPTTERV